MFYPYSDVDDAIHFAPSPTEVPLSWKRQIIINNAGLKSLQVYELQTGSFLKNNEVIQNYFGKILNPTEF